MSPIRYIICLSLLFLLTLSAVAQRDTVETSQLRIPTGADYLALLDELLMDEKTDWLTPAWISEDIVRFRRLHDESVSADDILATYRLMFDRNTPLSPDEHVYWAMRLLNLWFEEDDIDLHLHNQLTLGDFIIDIKPVDFVNDGQPEYILRLTLPSDDPNSITSYEFGIFLLAYEQAGDFVFTQTPLPVNLEYQDVWQTLSWSQLFLEDINQDGMVDWVMLGHSPAFDIDSRDFWYALFHILTWDGEQWHSYAPTLLNMSHYPRYDVSWTYRNDDSSQIVEFMKATRHQNNWGCVYETHDYFDWSATAQMYDHVDTIEYIPESLECLWWQAEEAMWVADFETAILLYEQLFAVALTTPIDGEIFELFQYMQARYVLALIMKGDNDRIQTAMETLNIEDAFTVAIRDLWTVITQDYVPDTMPYDLCLNVYKLFDIRGYSPTIVQGIIGETRTDYDLFKPHYDFYINPLTSGCDLEWLIESQTDYHNLGLVVSPLQAFEDSNIPIRHSISFDWNRDGYDDWIIAVDAPLASYVFLSDPKNNIYQVVRVWDDIIDGSQTHYFESLDRMSGLFIHTIQHSINETTCAYLGRATVWQVNNGEFDSIASIDLCDIPDWNTRVSSDGTTIMGWRYLRGGKELVETAYIWQPDDRRYTREDFLHDQHPTPRAILSEGKDTLLDILVAGNDPSSLIQEMEEAFEQVDLQENSDLVARTRYVVGLAYMALNQPDDALTAFLDVVERAPESVWGQLAGLYIADE